MTAAPKPSEPGVTTQPGPCIVCGKMNYSLSFGGPTICPSCDCGATTGSHLSYAAGKAAGIEAAAQCCEQKWRDGYRGEVSVGFAHVIRALAKEAK
jgi:hypothetical protein